MKSNNTTLITGTIVDIVNKKIFSGEITINQGFIINIKEHVTQEPQTKHTGPFILPGFIDAHIHIESSMLTPAEFSRIASIHGTVATVSDPHEIANVMGISGINYMINNAQLTPFKFYFSAPSCVPATDNQHETSGAQLGVPEIDTLLKRPDIYYLGEVMNYPGVINKNKTVLDKIACAKKYNKPIDGHAPGLRGHDLTSYSNAGISTDHECFTLEEALEKIKNNIKILIRQGSAAKNFDALSPLLSQHPDACMLCSDDLHPNDLYNGHINLLVKKAIAQGHDLMNVLRAATLNPIKHYNLNVGLLQKNDPADFIIIDNLNDFTILQTYIQGHLVAQNQQSCISIQPSITINNFSRTPITIHDLSLQAPLKINPLIRVIQARDGQLVTRAITRPACIKNGFIVSDPRHDILKIAVINRYNNTPLVIGFINNIGIKRGAFATSVAHDSHNIIAVGVTDQDLCNAINLIISHKGGLCAVYEQQQIHLPLHIAGLMSTQDYGSVAQNYNTLDAFVKKLGSHLQAPFMTLSFMALLVIPELKLSDKGLFDSQQNIFVPLIV